MAHYPRANPAKWWKTRSIGSVRRSPHAMFVSRFRRWTSILALIVLTGMVGGAWYLTNPNRISAMAGIVLSHVLGGRVTVKTGHLSLAGTLSLAGVRLITRGDEPVLFAADRVEMQFNWLSLFTGRLLATRISALRPTLNLIENRKTGRWNYQSLLQSHPLSSGAAVSTVTTLRPRLPTIVLRDARVRWGRIMHGVYRRTGQSVINARLGPFKNSHSTYVIEMEQRSVGGTPGITLKGRWNLLAHRFTARIHRLNLTPTFRRTLPLVIQRWWNRFALRGSLRHIIFRVSPKMGAGVSAQLRRVSMRLELNSKRFGTMRIPVRGMSGSVVLAGSGLTVKALRGRIMNYSFRVPSAAFTDFDDGLGSPAFHLTIELPHWRVSRRYPRIVSTRAFRAARGIIYQLRPSGLMDVRVQVNRALGSATPRVRGQILCRRVRARYALFPYPMHDIRGVIRFSRHEIDFVHLHGLAETFPVALDGEVAINGNNGPVDLRISSNRAYFDRRLEACLPRAIQPIWRRLNPVGWGRFVCHVRRAAGVTGIPKITLHIFPTDVQARYVGFPYPLRHVHGELYFTRRQTRIIRLTAPTPAGGAITFTGAVDYSPGDLRDLQPHIRVVAQNIPMTRTLRQSLPRQYARWIRSLHARGNVGLNAMITRGPGGRPSVRGLLTIHGGRLQPSALPWPMRDVSMRALLAPDHLQILQLTGRTGADGKGTFTAKADIHQLRKSRRNGIQVQATGQWQKVAVTPVPPLALPPAWRAEWLRFKPSGPLDGALSIAMTLHPGTPVGINMKAFHLVLQPENMRASPAFLPGPLTNILGTLTIDPRLWRVKQLNALAGAIHLQVAGSYVPATQSVNDFSLSASADQVDKKWLSALPPPAKNFLLPLALQGTWTLKINKLSRTMRAGMAHWSFTSALVLRHPRTAGALPAQANNISLTMACDWTTGQSMPNLLGHFWVQKLLLAGKMIDSLKGKFSADALKNTISVGQVRGVIAGGTLTGYVHIHAANKTNYHAAFLLNQAQLAGLLAATPTSAAAATTGRNGDTGIVDANLTLRGRLDKPQSRTGNGKLVVRKANIYNVPLAMGLLQIATLRLPISLAFKHAQILYRIHNHTVHFTNIRLESGGVNVVGRGTMNLTNRRLNLHLVTESPQGTRLPIIGLFFGLARSQLLQLRVGGTIEKPNIHVLPLHFLTWPFE